MVGFSSLSSMMVVVAEQGKQASSRRGFVCYVLPVLWNVVSAFCIRLGISVSNNEMSRQLLRY